MKKVDKCEAVIKEYLADERKKWKNQSINLFGTGKTRYILEFPENVAPRLPKEYLLKSQKKGFKRYATEELTELAEKLFKAEEERDVIAADVTRKVFADFSARRNKWNNVVSQIAILDCLGNFNFMYSVN